MPEPHSSSTLATIPEIDGSMTPSDLVFVLEGLRFGRRTPLVPLLIDEAARDYLVGMLRSRRP